MEIANLLFNADNVRMLVLLAFGVCGFMWLRMTFDRRFYKIEKSFKNDILDLRTELKNDISDLRTEFKNDLSAFHTQLKTNDFAHLNSTIEALTFTLEKNKFLTSEDKAYIDGRLDK